jgi:hypothetical protein
MSDVSPPAVRAHEYKLFVRQGAVRFYLKNNDEGVWLSERGIGWYIEGVSHTREWHDLAMVHLQVGYVPKHGSFGSCVLHFSDGYVVTIVSASKWGGVDDERNVEYGRFLADLHRAIPQAMREKIVFQSGVGKFRHVMLSITILIAGIFFVILPIGLFFYVQKLEVLFVLAAGAAFIWPMFRMLKASEPRTYDPAQVPKDLFP